MSGGVPAGTNIAFQLPTSSPLKPCSSAVGTSGSAVIRLVPVTPRPRIRLLCTLAMPFACGRNASWMSPPISAVTIGASPR